MSRIAIFEGADDATQALTSPTPAPVAPARKSRKGIKRNATSPKQAERQVKFKGCVRECKGTGKYRVCMSACMKSASPASGAGAMNGAKRRK